MSDGLGQDAAKGIGSIPPSTPVLSRCAIWQLLIAIFLLPRLGDLVQFLSRHIRWINSWELNYWDSDRIGNLIVCCLQIGLVCHALGPATTRRSLRWAMLILAIAFLALQVQSDVDATSVWLSTATVLFFLTLWDPFAWRAQIATLIGFWMVAVWYSDVGRDATALINVAMFAHCTVVAAVLVCLRLSGWQLQSPNQEYVDNAPRFTFAQFLIWVTCCGLGLALLRFVDFGADHTLVNPFADSDNSRIFQLLTFVILTPLLNLLAVYFTLHQKFLRYWLVMLAAAAGLAMFYAWSEAYAGAQSNGLGNFRLLNIRINRVPPPWHSGLADAAINQLPFALIPTALLIAYHAAGFGWEKKRKLKAEPGSVATVRGSAPER
jgi:hypothetical protein